VPVRGRDERGLEERNDRSIEVDMFVTNFELDPLARKRVMYRLIQLGTLALTGLFFLIAALAQPVFGSTRLGWECLAGMIVAVIAFWWSGRQADRRS
jgi:hypothetical protein